MRALLAAIALLASIICVALLTGGHAHVAPAGRVASAAVAHQEAVRAAAAHQMRKRVRAARRLRAQRREDAPIKRFAERRALAPIPGQTPLSAYGGYVVWSQDTRSTGRYTLHVWHDGVSRKLPVPSRSVPFDADAGPDAAGNPAVVFSRCHREPLSEVGSDWSNARGCRIYELALRNGLPREISGLVPPGDSGTTPAIFNGDIAFALRRRGDRVPTLMLWRQQTGAVVALHGGHQPRCNCAARVTAMDLGATTLAFVWDSDEDDSTFGIGASDQLRVDRLASGRSVLLEQGFTSGACGGEYPAAPSVISANRVAFLDYVNDCDNPGGGTHSVFRSCSVHTRRCVQAEPYPVRYPAGEAYAMARDGDATFWVLGPNEDRVNQLDSCDGQGCVLVRSGPFRYSKSGPSPTE